MEKGYYAPDIEEFHVGFKYEERYNKDTLFFEEIVKDDIEEWPNHDQLSKIKWSIHNIRVKYLDKADIESLGFKSSIDDGVVCYNKEYYNIYWFGDVVISIDKVYNSNRISLFKGSIKNKSELIVILKQIGIIEE